MKTFSASIGEVGIPAAPAEDGAQARGETLASPPSASAFISTQLAGQRDRALAFGVVAVSLVLFFAALPFAKQQLAQVWAFIPAYQSALVVCDLVTAALLLSQVRLSRSVPIYLLALGYLFTAALAVVHALSFPGLFAPGGVLGGGAQSTAWLYMFWHAAFPLCVIAYALLPERRLPGGLATGIFATLAAVGVLGWLATSGESLLPAIMRGNRYTSAMIVVVGTVWGLSAAALLTLWRRRRGTLLDLCLMVVMCVWIFDIGLAAVFNGGRFDLGFYAGRIYGLAAASLVLVVLLLENAALHAGLAAAHDRDQRALARHEERLRILHAIDRAMAAEQPAAQIAAAVIQPLRELLGVPRAIVNRFDHAAGEVEWVAAAGRRRTHAGPGVRYPLALMGDLGALGRGEAQTIDVHALPAGPHREALLASGVRWYVAAPMVAGGELIGAISFGGEQADFPREQVNIAREVATQLAIATMQTRLLERVKAHAAELESRVLERTAELEAVNKELASFSYSVSHDLRAPLRAVDGYARMLEEDYAARLDDEGRRLLGVIRGSANRMGLLIDDLLNFSRLGRQPLVRQSVDVAALVREVVGEVRGNSPASVEIGDLPPAHADRALLKQVWLNLVGNAFKYSGKQEAPRVQIGGEVEGEEHIYWVRDNGAGFDMRYAEKLFGVFQRLHSQEEFPGTGVGLAIVQRVVARHGGRVWAESKPGEGACFHFTVSTADAHG
jgi:signal transduction histidine kinase